MTLYTLKTYEHCYSSTIVESLALNLERLDSLLLYFLILVKMVSKTSNKKVIYMFTSRLQI